MCAGAERVRARAQLAKLFNPAAAQSWTMASAFDHFLLHTGGRGILDELEKELSLAPDQARARRLLSVGRLCLQPSQAAGQVLSITVMVFEVLLAWWMHVDAAAQGFWKPCGPEKSAVAAGRSGARNAAPLWEHLRRVHLVRPCSQLSPCHLRLLIIYMQSEYVP